MRRRVKFISDQTSFVFSHSVDSSTPWRPDSTTRAFNRLREWLALMMFDFMTCATMSPPGYSAPELMFGRLLDALGTVTVRRLSMFTPISLPSPMRMPPRFLEQFSTTRPANARECRMTE